jgi:hypothetical protein
MFIANRWCSFWPKFYLQVKNFYFPSEFDNFQLVWYWSFQSMLSGALFWTALNSSFRVGFGVLNLEFIILLDFDFHCEIILLHWNWNSNLNWVVIYLKTSKLFLFFFLKYLACDNLVLGKHYGINCDGVGCMLPKKKKGLCYQKKNCNFNSRNYH